MICTCQNNYIGYIAAEPRREKSTEDTGMDEMNGEHSWRDEAKVLTSAFRVVNRSAVGRRETHTGTGTRKAKEVEEKLVYGKEAWKSKKPSQDDQCPESFRKREVG